jgi:hypothetical protein
LRLRIRKYKQLAQAKLSHAKEEEKAEKEE